MLQPPRCSLNLIIGAVIYTGAVISKKFVKMRSLFVSRNRPLFLEQNKKNDNVEGKKKSWNLTVSGRIIPFKLNRNEPDVK